MRLLIESPAPLSPARGACPACDGVNLRVNVYGEQIRLVGIDPVSGEVKHGMAVDFIEGAPVPIYFCDDCRYENVVSSMFVRREE